MSTRASFNSPQAWEMRIEYIGPWVDSTFLNYNIDSIEKRSKLAFESKEQARYYSEQFIPLSDSLSISIDTSQLLYVKRIFLNQNDVKEVFYKSFPVFIKNDGRLPGRIGFGYRVIAYVEALDPKGVWRLIEKPFIYKCGTGMSDIFLKKDHYACFLLHQYTGEYSTTVRVRIGDAVSKPVLMHINIKQFWKTYPD